MKKLKFEKLWLLSMREKKARVEQFQSDITAIVAGNEFGKSSLAKSLYSAMGADPYKTSSAWLRAQVTSLIQFSVNDESYWILRQGSHVSLFDSNRTKLWSVGSIVKGLGPELANLLDFEIKLKVSGGPPSFLPPAFCFLPFYVDQDHGWNEAWASFSGLGMVPNYKDDVANFHTGIRPKEYYKEKSKKSEATSEKKELSSEREALKRAESRFKEKRSTVGIAFEPKIFSDRIDALLKEQNALQLSADNIKLEISALQSRRSVALEEMEIARSILQELDADVKFVEKLEDHQVVCPVCSTVHQNDFANRFGLINDADACRIVFNEAQQKVSELDEKIQRQLEKVPSFETRIERISALLAESRGQVLLGDMLRDESERIVEQTFVDETKQIDADIGEVDERIRGHEAGMRKFTSKKHKDTITEFYAGKMRAFCNELGIADIPDKLLKSVRPVIDEVGSSKPRLLLAYYYAVLHTISEFSTSCFCPIVLDTLLQQDPDPENAKLMTSFAINRRPEGSQLIMATGDLQGVSFEGQVIEPSSYRSLLQEDQYESVLTTLTPFINSAMQ